MRFAVPGVKRCQMSALIISSLLIGVEKKEAVCHQLDVSDIFIKARLITAVVCYSGVCRDCKGQFVFVNGSDHREC